MKHSAATPILLILVPVLLAAPAFGHRAKDGENPAEQFLPADGAIHNLEATGRRLVFHFGR